MALTLGRIGVSTTNGGDGATLAGPDNVTREGSTITVTGSICGSTQAASVWQAKQIAGLVDGEEPVIPVTFTDAAELDGFYRVLSASVDYRMVGSTVYEAFIPWQVQLEEIQGFRLARIDYPTVYGLVTNGVTVTSYDHVYGFPTSVVDRYAAVVGTLATRSLGDTGTCSILYYTDTDVGPTASTYRLAMLPTSYYQGGCRVEWDIGSSTYRSATGRASWAQAGDVRLSNGLVRAEWAAATSSSLTLSWWDGSTWSTATNFSLWDDTNIYTAAAARVVCNTPEKVVVRFTGTPLDLTEGAATFDLIIRRGVRWLTIYAQATVATAWRCGFNSSVASTAAGNEGLIRTSNNGSGDKELILSTVANTINTTTGTVTVDVSAATAVFGIGCEINGSSSSGRDDDAVQRREWYGLHEERGIVVAN